MDFHETFLEGFDGTRLFLRGALPKCPVVANIIHIHGMGEHSARYFHVAECFAKYGCRFCSYDMRGHGRSAGRRGYIADYSELINDLAIVWNHYRVEGLPMFLYGHSLGGQIAINFLAQRRPDARGAIITSPWFELAFRPNRFKMFLANIATHIWPTFTQHTGIDGSRLSRDQDFLAAMPDLDLVHRRMSAKMFTELSRGAIAARRCAHEVALPLLLIHGADDPVTSVEATLKFYKEANSQDKTLKVYPSTLHETHNDFDREAVLADITSWMRARL